MVPRSASRTCRDVARLLQPAWRASARSQCRHSSDGDADDPPSLASARVGQRRGEKGGRRPRLHKFATIGDEAGAKPAGVTSPGGLATCKACPHPNPSRSAGEGLGSRVLATKLRARKPSIAEQLPQRPLGRRPFIELGLERSQSLSRKAFATPRTRGTPEGEPSPPALSPPGRGSPRKKRSEPLSPEGPEGRGRGVRARFLLSRRIGLAIRGHIFSTTQARHVSSSTRRRRGFPGSAPFLRP